jgi:hypothetical protein
LNGTTVLNSAEIFDPATGTFTAAGNLNVARVYHTASALPDGRILIVGGQSGSHLASMEIFDPASKTFTLVPGTLLTPRSKHTATTLNDGKVFLAGGEKDDLLVFDVNFQSTDDNISPNIVFTSDSKTGFVSYTGSGVVVAFSPETGDVIKRIVTGGKPAFITPVLDGRTLAVVSVLDNKVFIIDEPTLTLKNTYTFSAQFGFGSILTASPDGNTVYVSSSGTGEVIKFNAATGNEQGRLTGLQSPAQITVTKNGGTLLIVDTAANEVIIADPASMTTKNKVTPLKDHPTTSFTIFNKAVLNPDESLAIIASESTNDATISCTADAAFIFKVSTGEITTTTPVGCTPGFTALMPTGTMWLVLGKDNFTKIPLWDVGTATVITIPLGSTLGSANIVISPDARYAYYALYTSDLVLQQDIGSNAVVGSFLVGDDPNLNVDQASSLAVTPNGAAMVVLNFASNELNLLVDNKVLRQTRFLVERDDFTGLSLVNLSSSPATMTVSALTNSATEFVGDTLTNPATFQLAPNAQKSVDLGQLINFDTTVSNEGRLFITSDQMAIAGFSVIGKIRGGFQNFFVSSMIGIPLQHDYRDSLHNWIIPEIPIKSTTTPAFNFLDPNYNTSSYDMKHYAADGTVLETKLNQTLSGSSREAKVLSDFVTSTQAGQVAIIGGFDSSSTKASGDLFTMGTKTFALTNVDLSSPRQGHTATLLDSDKILVTGGKDAAVILKSADLYDPVANIFTPTPGTMRKERFRHTATRLASGKVLIAGGQNSSSINNTAELYNPITGAFESAAGPMVSARDGHTATLLNDGRVLLTGGIDGIGVSATAEIYDPATSLFQPTTGHMNAARVFHTAVKLPDGKVLIAGGYNGNHLDSAEIYNPSTGLFTPTATMTAKRSHLSGTLLSNGTVLIAGGKDSSGSLDSAEIYDPNAAVFAPTEGSMVARRSSHTATLLNDDATGDNDSVLITGGFGLTSDEKTNTTTTVAEHALITAEYYIPATKQFASISENMSSAREGHTATLLQSGEQGYLRGSSEIGLLVTEVYDNGGASASINSIDVDKFVGITNVYSPQFVISSGFQTLLNLINANQDSQATVTLTLHASNGDILSGPVVQVLPKNAQIKGNLWDFFHNDPALQNKTGWIEVVSSVDRIVGTVSFTNADNDFLATSELSGTPLSHFIYPLITEDSQFQTGLALLNSGDSAASVELELWGPDGSLDGFVTIPIAPHAQRVGSLSDLFPGMQPHQSGNVRIRSNQPLHSFALLYARDLKFLSSESPVPFPE